MDDEQELIPSLHSNSSSTLPSYVSGALLFLNVTHLARVGVVAIKADGRIR